MNEFQEFLKENVEYMKVTKEAVAKIMAPHLTTFDLNKKFGVRKRKELTDLVRFIVASEKTIEILSVMNDEPPDFLITIDGEYYGLEHTELIDQRKKRDFEINQWFIKKIEQHFLSQFGDIGRHINISFKVDIVDIDKKTKRNLLKLLLKNQNILEVDNEILFRKAYPGQIIKKEIDGFAKEIAAKIYDAFKNKYEYFYNDPFLRYVSFYPSKKTSINRDFGYCVGSLSDILIKTLDEKEKDINACKVNTNGIKQCLFMVIQGTNGYSDYAFFDTNILNNRVTKFDKIIAFNFFTTETFYLK
jgi:hypothetical protein